MQRDVFRSHRVPGDSKIPQHGSNGERMGRSRQSRIMLSKPVVQRLTEGVEVLQPLSLPFAVPVD